MKAKVLILLQAAMIALAGCWVFSPAIHGDWLWDEIPLNSAVHDSSGLGKIWFAPTDTDYLPLKTTVQWAEWRLWGNQVTGYHATSIALHLLSALLLWRLLRKLGVRLAWLGGLVFAIHPLTVESVAWIAELKNTLSLPFLLGAMCAYIDWDTRQARTRAPTYLLSLFLFLAAMLSKSSVVMFPVVLLLYAWWRRGRIERSDLRASAPFFGVSAALGLVTVWFQLHRAIGNMKIPMGGILSRIANAGLAAAFYLGKCLWPAQLLPFYPHWTVDPPSILQFLPWIAGGSILVWLWAKRATWGRGILFGLGCFLINLAPVLGFVPMAWFAFSPVADHLAYLPIVPVIGLAVTAFDAWYCSARKGYDRDPGRQGHRQPSEALPSRIKAGLSMVCVALICALLAFKSHRYAGIFRNEETFWTVAVHGSPRSPQAHDHRGVALTRSGRELEAISEYEQALRLDPDYAEAYCDLGLAFKVTGRIPEAIAQYEAALRIKPDSMLTHNDLGNALIHAGRLQEAITQYQEALRLDPDYFEVHYNLGLALAGASRLSEAIFQLKEAIRLRPDVAQVWYNLGAILSRAGRLPEAIDCFQKAERLQAK